MAFNKSLAGYFDDLQHVGIPTDDLDKTVAFWEKLGFKMTGRPGTLTLTIRATKWSLCPTPT